MAPILRRGAGLAAVLGAVAFAPPTVQAAPQHSTDCWDFDRFEDYCWDIQQTSYDFRSLKCDSYFPDTSGYGCQYVPVYNLCPRSCAACLYYDDQMASSCGEPEYSWSEDEGYTVEDTGTAIVSIIFYLFCCGCAFVVPAIQLCLFVQAHQKRQLLLHNARQGPVPVPADNCCYLCMCGCVAIYYWEGISANWLITFFVWPWWGVCCWNKTPYPMDNGVQIFPPGQAQLHSGMQVQYVQPGFQPGMQQPPIAQAQVVQATVIQPGATVVGAPVATTGESYADK